MSPLHPDKRRDCFIFSQRSMNISRILEAFSERAWAFAAAIVPKASDSFKRLQVRWGRRLRFASSRLATSCMACCITSRSKGSSSRSVVACRKSSPTIKNTPPMLGACLQRSASRNSHTNTNLANVMRNRSPASCKVAWASRKSARPKFTKGFFSLNCDAIAKSHISSRCSSVHWSPGEPLAEKPSCHPRPGASSRMRRQAAFAAAPPLLRARMSAVMPTHSVLSCRGPPSLPEAPMGVSEPLGTADAHFRKGSSTLPGS
mmetsp:Transcript_91352/g.241610  ORF Transcript_91352/g.241610 Transcript_91352/m.241610 type:complete len:260 (-) Transcript_91352:293-1072(-)